MLELDCKQSAQACSSSSRRGPPGSSLLPPDAQPLIFEFAPSKHHPRSPFSQVSSPPAHRLESQGYPGALNQTDLNSAEQQLAPPSSGSVHTYLLGYLDSMKNIIVCMVCTSHGIYHLQLYTAGTSHLYPVTYHLIPSCVPKQMIHTMLYTIQIAIYREARIGQTCIYHGT
jgi:hypothetical protein